MHFFKRLLSTKGASHTHQLKVHVYRKVSFSMWFFIGDPTEKRLLMQGIYKTGRLCCKVSSHKTVGMVVAKCYVDVVHFCNYLYEVTLY